MTYPNPPSATIVAELVCRDFGMTIDDLHSGICSKRNNAARAMIGIVLYRNTDLHWLKITEIVYGVGKSHSRIHDTINRAIAGTYDEYIQLHIGLATTTDYETLVVAKARRIEKAAAV